MSTGTSDCIEIAVMRTLCKRFKTRYSKSVLKADISFESIVAISPGSYTSSAEFSKDYLLSNFLKKWTGWRLKELDPRSAAISSWTAAEHQCLNSNIRISKIFSGEGIHPHGIISDAQRKILNVIGDRPDFELLDGLCRWSNGATYDIRRGGTIADKMSKPITVTRRAVKHLDRILSEDSVWLEYFNDFEIVEGNRCVCVPKTAKTHRMIAAEPTGNAFMQQSVGRFIRSRLKRFGVDLDDQSVNQELAFEAVFDGMSTLDLSMASDTLCSAIVELLLPPEWYEYLCDLRSPKSRTVDGNDQLIEKFSSMGNAFTFELESLIFWALVSATAEANGDQHPVSVYGDDIICGRESYDNVVAVLKWAGFSVNSEKSYKDGSFFESCGKHFFDSEDVTPAYQKSVVGGQLFELIRLHNRLYRWGQRNDMSLVKDACNQVIERAHRTCRKLPYIPDHIGDDRGFLTNDSAKFETNRNGDYRCYVLKTISITDFLENDLHHKAFYSYKLRSPSYSNISPDGQVHYKKTEKHILSYARVWRSS